MTYTVSSGTLNSTIPYLVTTQQCQSTEGKNNKAIYTMQIRQVCKCTLIVDSYEKERF